MARDFSLRLIRRDAAAISDINAAAGSFFALGVASLSLDGVGTDAIRFSRNTESRTHQLELVVVPEPTTALLLSMSLVAMSVSKRRFGER